MKLAFFSLVALLASATSFAADVTTTVEPIARVFLGSAFRSSIILTLQNDGYVTRRNAKGEEEIVATIPADVLNETVDRLNQIKPSSALVHVKAYPGCASDGGSTYSVLGARFHGEKEISGNYGCGAGTHLADPASKRAADYVISVLDRALEAAAQIPERE